ncbi:hypothetical protein GWI33_020170 [Rhynchophorus ferrugineus]|uniref:Uncharacterized protein n=1 Tax=Rhynchophorus ferrugineus TaxID=354439 RepID=A0A834I3U9_RHYFE|nr:hypothetical protein GWI33_020170 [Rhynchophorus ferrugineus]
MCVEFRKEGICLFKLLTKLNKNQSVENYSPKNSNEEEEELISRETDWLLSKMKNRCNEKCKGIDSPKKNYVTPTIQNTKILKEMKLTSIISSNLQDYNTIKETLKVITLIWKKVTEQREK